MKVPQTGSLCEYDTMADELFRNELTNEWFISKFYNITIKIIVK